jgi:serine/threonine-protein kinase
MKLLGKGGMGEVVLVRDQDIARTVALKRLLPEAQDPTLLARFVDEIRTVGRLEHPNIVPIHDVGVDDLGRYFFVMKYVEGETLEAVIEKLQAGDKEYERKYSFEQRIEVFLGILHALEFAHANGFVHRDIKPANVMIGRYGEIILMDWGISKPLAQARDAASSAAAELVADGDDKDKARLFATRVGSLIGTPAYMSPEQARGDNASVDVRSDLYSAAVLFHELVSLQHYLHDKQTLEQMLQSCIHEEFGFMKILGLHGSTQGPPPGELIHFTHKGLSKDPAKRFQSAAEMIQQLQQILAGEVKVQCHITFTKSTFRRLGRLVDRKPHVALLALLGMFAGVIFSAVTIVRMIV